MIKSDFSLFYSILSTYTFDIFMIHLSPQTSSLNNMGNSNIFLKPLHLSLSLSFSLFLSLSLPSWCISLTHSFALAFLIFKKLNIIPFAKASQKSVNKKKDDFRRHRKRKDLTHWKMAFWLVKKIQKRTCV